MIHVVQDAQCHISKINVNDSLVTCGVILDMVLKIDSLKCSGHHYGIRGILIGCMLAASAVHRSANASLYIVYSVTFSNKH